MSEPSEAPPAPSGDALFGIAGGFFLLGSAVNCAADLAYRAESPDGEHGPESAWILAYTCVALGAGLGIALLLARRRLPARLATPLPLIAIIILTVPMLEGQRVTPTGSILLLWPVLYAGCLLSRRVTLITTGASVLALFAASLADPRRTLIGYGPTAATLLLTVSVVATLQHRMHGLVSQLAREAHTDPLTGLANRRTLLDALGREVAAHRRRSGALSLLMIDADRFKQVNDTAGHEVGDDVLRRLAVLVRRETRSGDLAARFGGEEFTVIMTDCRLADAFDRADQLRALIADESADWPRRITVSIGVAELPLETPEANAGSLLIEHADTALYEAKRGGRDRVRAYKR